MNNESGTNGIGKNSLIVIVGQFGSIFIKFFSNILLAWFLTPDAFGVAAIVMVVLIGLSLLSDVGIADSIVRNPKGGEEDFYRSAFVVQLVRGLVLYLFVVLISKSVADFYNEDILQACLLVGGVSLITEGFYSTRAFVMQRNHQVKPLVILDISAQLITAVLVLIICFFNPTVWALIFAHIFSSVVRLIGSHYLAPMSFHGFKIRKKYFYEIFGFGKWIFLATLFHFVITQSDKLMLGKLVAPSELGVYSIAAALAGISLMLSFNLGVRILYPVLSEAARESKDIYSLKLDQVLRQLLPILLAFIMLTFAYAPPFFEYLYKSDYGPAGGITQLLAIMTWFMIVYDLYHKVPVSYGAPEYTAFCSFVTSVFRVLLSLLGFQAFGLPGFIVGLATGSVIGVSTVQVWMFRKGLVLSFYELKLSLFFFLVIALYYGSPFVIGGVYQKEILALFITALAAFFLFFSYKTQITAYMRERSVTVK
jgi:O-antigen/teichoic acid export membrane protein